MSIYLGPDSNRELSTVLQGLGFGEGVFSIPVEANFAVNILDIPYNTIDINESFRGNNQIEPRSWSDSNNLQPGIVSFTESSQQNTNNILFASEVKSPGENLSTSKVGPSTENTTHGILLSAPVIKGRKDNDVLTIGFIETNASFTDYVIRPWILAVSHFGLFNRSKNSKQRVKADLCVVSFDSRSLNNVIRKKITYYDCAPVSLDSSTYKYTENAQTRIINTTWVYSSYTIENSN